MNYEVGIPDSVICIYHELQCTLAKLFWVVNVERLGDNCVAIDGCVQILIEVGVKWHHIKVVPENLVSIIFASINFCIETILRKDKMSQVALLVHVFSCFFAHEEGEGIMVDKPVIFVQRPKKRQQQFLGRRG